LKSIQIFKIFVELFATNGFKSLILHQKVLYNYTVGWWNLRQTCPLVSGVEITG